MCTKPYTVVNSKRMRERVLNGIWGLKDITSYVGQEGGDIINFTFTRIYPNGKRDYFTVTDGELKEVTPRRSLSHDSICK